MINEQNPQKQAIITGKDSVVIVKYTAGIPGGRTLDCSGFTGDNIYAGHVIVKKDGRYSPLAVECDGYAALAEGAEYAGVLYRTIPVKNPEAAIMFDGVVNPAPAPYAFPADFKAACPNITFIQEEEA